jgi:hypothetical protein
LAPSGESSGGPKPTRARAYCLQPATTTTRPRGRRWWTHWPATRWEIVTATTVTAGNAGNAEPASDLLADDLPTGTDTATGDGVGTAAGVGAADEGDRA